MQDVAAIKKIYEQGVQDYLKCNYKDALSNLTEASRQGYPAADLWLGIYQDRDNFTKNKRIKKELLSKVVSNIGWFIQEAETGDPLAQNNLGYCNYYGHGVPENYEKAVKYYQLAADQGLAVAQHNLAGCYLLGDGVLINYEKAVENYQLAAKQGYARSQYMLSIRYWRGKGVVQDFYQAIYYQQLADNQGLKLDAKLASDYLINYAKARIACDNKDYAKAISLCQTSLQQYSKDNKKPVWILLAIVSMCLAATTDDNVKLSLSDIEAIKEYKKELFAAIKQLPCANIYDENERQNQILLAAFENRGIVGAIFHAPRHTWMPDFFGGGKCETDSGTLKDIAEELVTRGLLMKQIGNQDSVVGAAVDSLISYFKNEKIEKSAVNFHLEF